MKLRAALWVLGEAEACFSMALGRAAAGGKCVVMAERRIIALVTDFLWRAKQKLQNGVHGNWDF